MIAFMLVRIPFRLAGIAFRLVTHVPGQRIAFRFVRIAFWQVRVAFRLVTQARPQDGV